MTKTNTKIVAAALALAAILLFGFFLWPRDHGVADAPPAKPSASQPRPAEPRRVSGGDDAPAAPPAGPQVSMDDDPVGPLVLEGQVLGSGDQPVGGATVTLSSNPPRKTKSDTDGSFSFDKLPPRTYSLTARQGDQAGGPVVHVLRAASDPVIIRLAAAASIDVTVVAAGSGAPIAGANVELRGDAPILATTDASGRARLTGVLAGTFPTVAASASGYATQQILVQVPDAPGAAVAARLELRRGAPVSGVVVDERDAPIAGARVWARDVSLLYDPANREDQVTTDDKGRFTLAAVAAGTYQFKATHPRHAPGATEARPIDGAKPIEGVRIALPAGARLAGRVVDGSGAPVGWAAVRVGPGQRGRGDSVRQAIADEAGAFALEGLGREKLLAVARAEGASSPSVPVDLGGGDVRDLVLRLEVAGRIEGVVVDSAGQPVAEAQVTAYPDFFGGAAMDDFALRGPAVDTSDGDGRFALRGLPAGSYRLHATRSRTSMAFGRRTIKAATGDTGVKLVLDADGGVRGRVQFADGSAPALFSVSIGLTAPLPISSGDGRFEVPAVPTGRHDLTVRGPDFAETIVRDVEVAPAQVRDVGVIKVDKGRSVSGRVLGTHGRPVAGATVVLGEQILADGRSLSSSLSQTFGEQLGIRQTTTDAQGHYAMTGIRVGRDLSIAAEHETEGRSPPAVVPAGSDAPVIDLRLAEVGGVFGKVTSGGKPIAAQIIATAPGVSRQNILVESGADGRYQIDRLAAGPYKVTAAVGTGADATTAGRQVDIKGGAKVQLDIDVPLGDLSLAITVKPKSGTLDTAQLFLFSGDVSVENAKQLNEAYLASGASGAKQTFGGVGSPANFNQLVPGKYSLCVIPLSGDINDPTYQQRLMRQVDKLKVYCSPQTLAETPKAQSATVAVPPMEPLE